MDTTNGGGGLRVFGHAVAVVTGGASGIGAALGRALARAVGADREAIQVLETATKLAPRDFSLFVDLALLLNRQGLKTRARRMLEMAQRLSPGHPRVARAASEIGAD